MLLKKFIFFAILFWSSLPVIAQDKLPSAELPAIIDQAPIDNDAKGAPHSMPFAGLGTKHWGSPVADTLMYLISIAEQEFAPVQDGIEEKHYLQADRIFAAKYELRSNLTVMQAQYQAKSFKAHPVAKDLRNEMEDIFEKLVAADHRYRFVKGDTRFDLFYDKSILLTCLWETSKYIDPYPIMTLNFFSKPKATLADEAAYGGKFPSAVANTNQPQIWELRGRGNTPDSYQRYNGIFRNGQLVSGTKTYHGYGAFYDGTWSSDAWPGGGGADKPSATFTPEGSQDKLYGTFYRFDMTDFMLDDGLSTYTKGAAGWVRDVYQPYRAKQDAIAHAREERLRSAGSAGQPQQSSQRNSTSKKDFWTVCSCCGGKGYTERYDKGTTYQIKDRYGNNTGTTSSQRITCTCCHGTGR